MLKRTTVVAGTLIVLGATVALAREISVWGQNFDVDDFQPQQLFVATMTDPRTHHKMNVVKLKNGHMMGLVSLEQLFAPTAMTKDEDMLP